MDIHVSTLELWEIGISKELYHALVYANMYHERYEHLGLSDYVDILKMLANVAYWELSENAKTEYEFFEKKLASIDDRDYIVVKIVINT